jgi:hypothetical protein
VYERSGRVARGAASAVNPARHAPPGSSPGVRAAPRRREAACFARGLTALLSVHSLRASGRGSPGCTTRLRRVEQGSWPSRGGREGLLILGIGWTRDLLQVERIAFLGGQLACRCDDPKAMPTDRKVGPVGGIFAGDLDVRCTTGTSGTRILARRLCCLRPAFTGNTLFVDRQNQLVVVMMSSQANPLDAELISLTMTAVSHFREIFALSQ